MVAAFGFQPPQVPGTMLIPVPRLILVAGYIQHPMQSVLHPPMAPHNGIEPFHTECPIRQIAPFCSHRAILLPNSGYSGHSGQTRPVMRFRQPAYIGADAGDAGFNAPMPFADLGTQDQRQRRVILKQPHIISQRARWQFNARWQSSLCPVGYRVTAAATIRMPPPMGSAFLA